MKTTFKFYIYMMIETFKKVSLSRILQNYHLKKLSILENGNLIEFGSSNNSSKSFSNNISGTFKVDFADKLKGDTQLYKIFQDAGYEGTEDDFYENVFPDLDPGSQAVLSQVGSKDGKITLEGFGKDYRDDPFAAFAGISRLTGEDSDIYGGTTKEEEEKEKKKTLEMLIEQKEDTFRNINWSLKKMEWDNLFNYAEDNVIDFTKLNGVVGIFGKNFSGKSSIIDSLLYTVYNSSSKSIRKNLNMINQNKTSVRTKDNESSRYQKPNF